MNDLDKLAAEIRRRLDAKRKLVPAPKDAPKPRQKRRKR